MMNKNENYIVNCICAFCGNRYQIDNFPYETDKLMEMPRCKNCWPKFNKGVQVRYGAAEQAPGDAVYADQYLKRGELYTATKVKRWMHGSYVYLEGFGNAQFNSRLFTPKDFVNTKGEKS